MRGVRGGARAAAGGGGRGLFCAGWPLAISDTGGEPDPELLGVEVAIRTLFEAPRAEVLAARLRETGPARPALRRRARPDPLPVSYAQQRLWFIDRLEGGSTEYNMLETQRLRGRWTGRRWSARSRRSWRGTRVSGRILGRWMARRSR